MGRYISLKNFSPKNKREPKKIRKKKLFKHLVLPFPPKFHGT